MVERRVRARLDASVHISTKKLYLYNRGAGGGDWLAMIFLYFLFCCFQIFFNFLFAGNRFVRPFLEIEIDFSYLQLREAGADTAPAPKNYFWSSGRRNFLGGMKLTKSYPWGRQSTKTLWNAKQMTTY